MIVKHTPIQGLMVVETEPYKDHRGAFARFFCRDELKGVVGSRQIVQINYSRTDVVGSVRGLHYQLHPHSEMKLIRCINGKVWDVAVDLRTGSPTYLKWHAEVLSKDNARLMVIPEGFAHGFQVLEGESELLYLHTAFYTPLAEGGVQPTDPKLAVHWPLPVQDLSDRDRSHPLLNSEFAGLIV